METAAMGRAALAAVIVERIVLELDAREQAVAYCRRLSRISAAAGIKMGTGKFRTEFRSSCFFFGTSK